MSDHGGHCACLLQSFEKSAVRKLRHDRHGFGEIDVLTEVDNESGKFLSNADGLLKSLVFQQIS